MAGTFTIARGAKTHVDIVKVVLTESTAQGQGEATPIYYHGEDAQSVAAEIKAQRNALVTGADRTEMNRLMPRGAARNAVDAALWDLEAKLTGQPVWQRAGLARPVERVTAFTISLGTPDRMRQDAEKAAPHYPLLKLKLAGQGDADRVAAVRAGAPDARLIVDANEAWTGRDLAAEAKKLVPFGVELIEQPVRAGQDAALDDITTPIPFCADESCQDRTDLPRCLGRYAAINIKLDKAGGLTEALALAEAASQAGLDVMVGCMLSTSLGIAPAFLAAQHARWVDLDGPLLLARDRTPRAEYEGGKMLPPPRTLWG